MVDFLLKILDGIHGLILLGSGLFYFLFCFRTRLWFPKYIHFLATLSLLLNEAAARQKKQK